jgi:hypothetical protein
MGCGRRSVNYVPTVEVQRVLDDRGRHGRWPITKLSLDHPIMCYRGNVVFFFLWTASVPAEALFLRLKPAKQRPPSP